MQDAVRDAVQTEVLETLAAVLKFDPTRLQAETSLDDAGIDSLGLVEAIFVIQERFDITIPFNANEQSSGSTSPLSVAQLLNQVVDLVMEKRSSLGLRN